MDDSLEALILDLLEWIEPEPRRYSEVMEAWRTSCPRLPIWEDATDRGLVERQVREADSFVVVTDLGRELLARHRNR